MIRRLAGCRPFTSPTLACRRYGTTSKPPPMLGPYTPEDWSIIEESPSGLELTFANNKTGQATFYTPPGMTATEILAIPDAKKYWSTTARVEKYIKEKAEEKERVGGEDYDTQT